MGLMVYLALGSNLGDRLSNLSAAIDALSPEVRSEACSPVYETPPWGYSEQPSFLNQVIRAETNLEPLDLLGHLKATELKLGRQPGFQNGPRLIDIDILFYEYLIFQSEDLVIPHPRLSERAFVLAPLVDLAPDLRHPLLGQTAQELLARVDAAGIHWFAPGECGETD